MDAINNLVSKMTGWVDNSFAFFGLYTSKYSKYILLLVALFLATKIFKIKLDLGGKRG